MAEADDFRPKPRLYRTRNRKFESTFFLRRVSANSMRFGAKIANPQFAPLSIKTDLLLATEPDAKASPPVRQRRDGLRPLDPQSIDRMVDHSIHQLRSCVSSSDIGYSLPSDEAQLQTNRPARPDSERKL
jgi:hypothetical protein